MSYDPHAYWEGRAASWASVDFPTAKQWETLSAYLDASLETLELGCGTGRWGPYFPEYSGCDTSFKLLGYARSAFPGKRFFYHDLSAGFPDYWEPAPAQVFTFTALLHVPPGRMRSISFPDSARVVLVEPSGESSAEHCFKHDYAALFGTSEAAVWDQVTIHVREPK